MNNEENINNCVTTTVPPTLVEKSMINQPPVTRESPVTGTEPVPGVTSVEPTTTPSPTTNPQVIGEIVTPGTATMMGRTVVDNLSQLKQNKQINPLRRDTMAELMQSDLFTLFRDHADIRRETADVRYEVGQGVNEIVKETIKASDKLTTDVKDASYRTLEAVGNEADRVVAQGSAYYIAGQQAANDLARDVAALKAGTDMAFMKVASDIQTQGALGQAASALESAKIGAAVALGQAQLERSINNDGNETRRLINELKVSELERKLIERHNDYHGIRGELNHWRGHYDQAQFAAINNQMQNFGSQLQETRQGVINFGTMTGNAGRQQSSNTNI